MIIPEYGGDGTDLEDTDKLPEPEHTPTIDPADLGIFTEEELKLKSIIRNARFGIIGNLTKGGVPEDHKSIRVLNEVMLAADSEIVETAKLRNSAKATQGDNALKQAILDRLSRKPDMGTPSTNKPVLVDVEVLESTITRGGELVLEDYIPKD